MLHVISSRCLDFDRVLSQRHIDDTMYCWAWGLLRLSLFHGRACTKAVHGKKLSTTSTVTCRYAMEMSTLTTSWPMLMAKLRC